MTHHIGWVLRNHHIFTHDAPASVKGVSSRFPLTSGADSSCHVVPPSLGFVCFLARLHSMLPFLLTINPPYFSCLLQVWKKHGTISVRLELFRCSAVLFSTSIVYSFGEIWFRSEVGEIVVGLVLIFQIDTAVLGLQSWSKRLFMTVVLRILDGVNFLILFRSRFYF